MTEIRHFYGLITCNVVGIEPYLSNKTGTLPFRYVAQILIHIVHLE